MQAPTQIDATELADHLGVVTSAVPRGVDEGPPEVIRGGPRERQGN